MTAQDGLYATKRTFFDLHLPLGTLKIRSYTILRLAESTETLIDARDGKRITSPTLSFDSLRVLKLFMFTSTYCIIKTYTILRLAESTETQRK